MPTHPEINPEQKDQLHPRNKHRSRYDFPELIVSCPELARYVRPNTDGGLSVDFKDPNAVKTLNQALLKQFYGISLWDIPEGYLCPPIPGRADYIHYAADLLTDKEGKIQRGKSVKVLDIGVGANCIYPLIGHKEYGWSFIGSEIDSHAIRSAKNIIEANSLSGAISVRKQGSIDHIFEGVIHRGEKFDLTICNPPFHASLQESMVGTERKWRNLGRDHQKAELNFGGKNAELWCEGGELRFVSQMIKESKAFGSAVRWFTSLISKKENLPALYSELKKVDAKDVNTINMAQGQKLSRVLAWSFQNKGQI